MEKTVELLMKNASLLDVELVPSVDKSTQARKACFGTLLRSRRLYYIQ